MPAARPERHTERNPADRAVRLSAFRICRTAGSNGKPAKGRLKTAVTGFQTA
ncbi:hypothetical protein V6667_03290 [Neisseria leonii]|uniref:hypothetical protein n=1 Tax=Neisseria leonii TaxID=2995413 RepID=UPI0030D01070